MENGRKQIYQFYIVLLVCGSLFYSAQGHNYMGGVAATAVYMTILSRFSSSKISEALIRSNVLSTNIDELYIYNVFTRYYVN